MLAAILSFTDEGEKTENRIAAFLEEKEFEVVRGCFGGTGKNRSDMTPGDFLDDVFVRARLLIFVGACGIAVRMIAPHIRDKKTDPAVLVADETGCFVISLLSGHLGGANRYARMIADEIGAVPVITTATDLEERFSPDLFAVKYHLKIRNMEDAKAVAAAGLTRPVNLFIDVPWSGELPSGRGAFRIFREKTVRKGEPCVLVTIAENPEILGCPQCVLTPANLVVGVGCRRGTFAEQILSFVREVLRERNISVDALRCFASIDLKKNEEGILRTAETFGVPFVTCAAEDMNALPGGFTASEFVKSHTGTDNVCERSAMFVGEMTATGGTGEAETAGKPPESETAGKDPAEKPLESETEGRFLLRKQAKNGVTLAIYEAPVTE